MDSEKNFTQPEESAPKIEEQSVEAILDILEAAFEGGIEGTKAELWVLDSKGELKKNVVLVEAYVDGFLYVSADEYSPVMPLDINNIKRITLRNEPKKERPEQ